MKPKLSGSDKPQSFLDLYDQFFEPLRDKPVRLLELGIAGGGSLRYWADYFPQGTIWGLDLHPPPINHPRIETIQADQGNIEVLDKLSRNAGPWDIIIDDCSHLGHLTERSYDALFPHLVPGGIYAIEDWGTGYWSDWPDGAAYDPRWFQAHDAGMVGVVKSLIDVVAANDIDRRSFAGHSDKQGEIAQLTIINGLVVARKR